MPSLVQNCIQHFLHYVMDIDMPIPPQPSQPPQAIPTQQPVLPAVSPLQVPTASNPPEASPMKNQDLPCSNQWASQLGLNHTGSLITLELEGHWIAWQVQVQGLPFKNVSNSHVSGEGFYWNQKHFSNTVHQLCMNFYAAAGWNHDIHSCVNHHCLRASQMYDFATVKYSKPGVT